MCDSRVTDRRERWRWRVVDGMWSHQEQASVYDTGEVGDEERAEEEYEGLYELKENSVKGECICVKCWDRFWLLKNNQSIFFFMPTFCCWRVSSELNAPQNCVTTVLSQCCWTDHEADNCTACTGPQQDAQPAQGSYWNQHRAVTSRCPLACWCHYLIIYLFMYFRQDASGHFLSNKK